MPIYTYRREDGSTFDVQQKFLDEPLVVCPTTHQKVTRVIQAPSIIFKGSGFYVNDSKNASKTSLNGQSNGNHSESKTEKKTETKSENKATEGDS